MYACLHSAALQGVDAQKVNVEVYAGAGEVKMVLVGLPDAAVRESIDRIKSALANSGLIPPSQRITINLAPADLKKEGPSFDLPIALALIAAAESLNPVKYEHTFFVGELALDGQVREVRGALSIALAAKNAGFQRIFVPRKNAKEASLIQGIEVVPIDCLQQAWQILNGDIPTELISYNPQCFQRQPKESDLDFNEVKGQEGVKRALEVAAAGAHNLLMTGPPGTGKSMLAQRLPSILPDLTEEEAIEVTRIHSIAGLLNSQQSAVLTRPFRSPHHTISEPGLLGGGSNPKPGEISLAHRGVLFLDELPEFKRSTLEVMRQPLEDRRVTVSRASASLTFPAHFMLIAAMNPCPCGYYGDPHHQCRCTAKQIEQYNRRISAPLLDRIDIQCHVPLVPFRQLQQQSPGETSATIRQRVNQAHQIQQERFQSASIKNATMAPRHLKEFAVLDQKCQQFLENAMERLKLSARAHNRIIKLARTIADLDGAKTIDSKHLLEAISYRNLDRASQE